MKKQTKLRSDFNIRNGELFLRMNYLLQLSSLLYNSNMDLSKHYIKLMKDVSKRNALRLDSKFKKLVCKCNNLLMKDKKTNMKLISKIYA
jgi:RNase P subunit RPR2